MVTGVLEDDWDALRRDSDGRVTERCRQRNDRERATRGGALDWEGDGRVVRVVRRDREDALRGVAFAARAATAVDASVTVANAPGATVPALAPVIEKSGVGASVAVHVSGAPPEFAIVTTLRRGAAAPQETSPKSTSEVESDARPGPASMPGMLVSTAASATGAASGALRPRERSSRAPAPRIREADDCPTRAEQNAAHQDQRCAETMHEEDPSHRSQVITSHAALRIARRT